MTSSDTLQLTDNGVNETESQGTDTSSEQTRKSFREEFSSLILKPDRFDEPIIVENALSNAPFNELKAFSAK